ncbi:MAG: hypothetical protein AAF773_00835 [Cyanobacteria bacterium P01_D01_bin.115]
MNKADMMAITVQFSRLFAALTWDIAEQSHHRIDDDFAPLLFGLIIGGVMMDGTP